jgi:hypothetical protein
MLMHQSSKLVHRTVAAVIIFICTQESGKAADVQEYFASTVCTLHAPVDALV